MRLTVTRTFETAQRSELQPAAVAVGVVSRRRTVVTPRRPAVILNIHIQQQETVRYGILLLVFLLLPLFAHADAIEARLISDIERVQQGRPFWVAIELTMKDEWHTYYVNPGDAGLGTTVDWRLPEGWAVDSLQWPTPMKFGEPPEVMYGYEGVVLLLARVTPASKISSPQVRLEASVSWLGCREVCIPGKADVALALPVDHMGETDPLEPTPDAERIQSTLRALPTPPEDGVSIAAFRSNGRIVLRVFGVESGDLYFFSSREEVIDHSAEQAVADDVGGAVLLTLQPSQYATEPATSLHGILAVGLGNERRAYAVDVEIAGGE